MRREELFEEVAEDAARFRTHSTLARVRNIVDAADRLRAMERQPSHLGGSRRDMVDQTRHIAANAWAHLADHGGRYSPDAGADLRRSIEEGLTVLLPEPPTRSHPRANQWQGDLVELHALVDEQLRHICKQHERRSGNFRAPEDVSAQQEALLRHTMPKIGATAVGILEQQAIGLDFKMPCKGSVARGR